MLIHINEKITEQCLTRKIPKHRFFEIFTMVFAMESNFIGIHIQEIIRLVIDFKQMNVVVQKQKSPHCIVT